MNEKLGDVPRCSMLAREPVERSSRHTTACPLPITRLQRCEPRNPAPPVMRTLTALPPLLLPDFFVAPSWAPEASVLPASGTPGLRVKAITSIDDTLRPGYRRKFIRLQFPKFIPLGENQDHIGSLTCIKG